MMTIPDSESSARHDPVLCSEVLAMAAPENGDIIVDGTFGAGGYSRALLQAADCVVYAIDRDPTVIETAQALAAEFPKRFFFLPGCFSEMDRLLADCGVTEVAGVVLDIGVSSMQLDDAERGFSFQNDGPLYMRMSNQGLSAEDVVNEAEESELADILYQYGEEKKSRRIARAIVQARSQNRITRTAQLANILEKAVGYKRYIKGKKQIHPATRSFQALRIYVNDELGELTRGLAAAERILGPGGRLCVVSFHSLEDRIVKNFLKVGSGEVARHSRHLPQNNSDILPTFSLLSRKGIKPSKGEIEHNSRARSARLRGAVRTATPISEKAQTLQKGAGA